MAAMSDDARLARLNALKLGALVRDHLAAMGAPSDGLVPGEFGGGAALTVDGEAWVLVAPVAHPGGGLGGAVVWALRAGAHRLHVVVDEGEGHLARRAEHLSMPVTVWRADGRQLVAATPVPLPVPTDPPSTHREFEQVIAAAGAVPFVEHGVLAGEVLGLEVCRVVDDPFTAAVRLEVGVGAHDREAFQMLHGDRPTAAALAEVVEVVRGHRSDVAAGHPLARLARERLLRAVLLADPTLVGLDTLTAVPPPLPRVNLKDPVPCVAEGVGADGVATVVVCSTGIDLDAVPYCIDARLARSIERCVLALPARDAVRLQYDLAGLTVPPVRLVTVDLDAALPAVTRP